MKPTQEQIDEVLNRIANDVDSGKNRFFGQTYGEGVEAAIRWMQGEDIIDNPYPDE